MHFIQQNMLLESISLNGKYCLCVFVLCSSCLVLKFIGVFIEKIKKPNAMEFQITDFQLTQCLYEWVMIFLGEIIQIYSMFGIRFKIDHYFCFQPSK